MTNPKTLPKRTPEPLAAAHDSVAVRKCKCELCTKWLPLHRRIMAKLRGKDRKLFDEFLMMEANQSDDLGSANAKLAGEWSGWEWMKVAVKLMMGKDEAGLLKDKARLDWLEQGASEKINSANDFVDRMSGRITREKIDEAMCPPNDA